MNESTVRYMYKCNKTIENMSSYSFGIKASGEYNMVFKYLYPLDVIRDIKGYIPLILIGITIAV